MTSPMQVLIAEHTVIERVLACLETMARGCRAGQPLDVEAAGQALDFLRTFADRVHHGKEEEHLFPLLEQRGMVRERGPTGVMLAEHEIGRRLMRQMAAAIEGHDSAGYADAAERYVELLRAHIQKENHCLFGMADHLLNAADRAALLEAFERQDAAANASGELERYRRLAEDLVRKLQVPLDSPEQCGGSCTH